ncbi:DUF3592 domain-containing protein [Rhodococcus sp. W8901]|uniref:DUF3592 domain-containing protein n=1 Tax=Rhodococcus sp. W8901 TaxID=2742603 RepID=UPI0015836E1F|nr:DUF3592 domain-containing protein [Rhodococcus sp. W8901]QKT13630.1 hypothetical protein HUN07_25350 [Rhodococcus sp. W8901]
MSTIDPIAARRARLNRPPGVGRVSLALMLLFAGGAGMGYGWPRMFGGGMEPESFDPPALAFVGALAGLPLAIAGFILWASIALKARHLGLLYGIAAWWTGAGIGVITAGRQIGDSPIVTGIGYGCLVIAAICLIGGLNAARGRRARRAGDHQTKRTGTVTTAIVSDKGYSVFRESDRIFTAVTFSFTDSGNTQRWVQRRMVVHAATPVVDGQQTRLWYDPADPGNDKKIVVELADEWSL